MSDIDAKIAEILTVILGHPVIPGTNILRQNEEKWDSLRHVEIILAIERAFDLELSEEEIASIKSVNDIQAVARKTHAS